VIQRAIDEYDTNAKETEILSDLCKNDSRNADENNEKDRPLYRPLYRPTAQNRGSGSAKKELSLKWKASTKETADEKNKTGKDKNRSESEPKPNAKVKKYTNRLRTIITGLVICQSVSLLPVLVELLVQYS
jgi:hypothetical protein